MWTQNAKATSSNVFPSPYGCHNKAEVSELYDVPSETELKSLILTTKSQKIYKDYSEFLKNKGYTEYTDSTFGGFFKKAPIIYKNAKYLDNKDNDFKFSYEINLKVKKPYILSVPFINTYDDSKIAGIVFVYSNQRVLSYIIEETSDSKNPSNNTADILLEIRMWKLSM